jgi:hypothetical protein
MINLNGCGHAGRKDDASWHLLDNDAYRNALGQANAYD